jgi:membrane-associated phospholipid phosphatase
VPVGAWGLLLAVLIGVGTAIRHSTGVQSFDQHITNFVVAHRSDALNQAMKVVTSAGTWVAVLCVAIATVVLIWRRRLPIAVAVVVLVAWLGEVVAVHVTKVIVTRPRPPKEIRLVVATGWSFPSGHAANSVVTFAAAALLVTLLTTRRLVRVAAWTLAVLSASLVAFSRIELGVHWTTDVIASLLWSAGWLAVLAKTMKPARPSG